MKTRTDDDLIKTCQLMNRLGITFSFCGGGKNPINGSDVPMEVLVTVNHLYDVLTKPSQPAICDLIDRELSENWPINDRRGLGV